ncbi:Kip1p, partial [Ascoidea rubescens DSM 1968]
EESNISVFVRCRSRNEREIKENSGVVVSTLGHMGKDVILKTGNLSCGKTKTYTFDRVFGFESDQETIFDSVASNFLDEVLDGYNCTVFAYGQTGTGKTYTMSGDIQIPPKNDSIKLSENAGIIPRTLVKLFKILKKFPEHIVKVSFIELYNEELKDLLLSEYSSERRVKIYDDPSKKSIIVQGMEEIFIKNAVEGLKLLSEGSYKRQVAATHCNDLSSRSHTVFTITVMIKQDNDNSKDTNFNLDGANEYYKVGKLNLVDLAGSENINRSGAENKRAREAGINNQSLLTLGRVINALVDNLSHIPYRESKLTRLLQDSLGGQTKTCIIATISPAKVSLEETLSTLEYANRAKNIKNKPQINQSVSKKLLIKEYIQEIGKLRDELSATRLKNGIYLSADSYKEITEESESRKIMIDDQKLRINYLESNIKKIKEKNEELAVELEKKTLQLEALKENFRNLQQNFDEIEKNLKISIKKFLLESKVKMNHQNNEKQLEDISLNLINTLNQILLQKSKMHNLIISKNMLLKKNSVIVQNLKKKTIKLKPELEKYMKNHFTNINSLSSNIEEFIQVKNSDLAELADELNKISEKVKNNIITMTNKTATNTESMIKNVTEIQNIKKDIKEKIISRLNEILSNFKTFEENLTENLLSINQDLNDNFAKIKTEINSTFNYISDRLVEQEQQIQDLKGKLITSRTSYSNLLKNTTKQIIDFIANEDQISKDSNDVLLKEITKLIENHKTKNNERIQNNLNKISNKLGDISNGF